MFYYVIKSIFSLLRLKKNLIIVYMTCDLKIEQDRLWGDHYWLTRQLIYDAVYGIPCLPQDLEALNQNQRDLGENFGKLVCSTNAGNKLTARLLEHIAIAVKIVLAAIQGDTATVQQQYALWVINAKQIAAIYNKYNSCIKLKVITQFMLGHLD